jgi:succinyl-CoA synthetase beta subunit
VEVLKDVTVQLHPLTDVAARQMIERIEGYPILAGARGEPGVALDLVASCLLRLSQMVGDLEDELAEIDVNPLIVGKRRADSFVVDARVALAAR